MKAATFCAIALIAIVCAFAAVQTERRKRRLERLRRIQIAEHDALVNAERVRLDEERQQLRGTGKVPFVDWETSFLESHQIRFRRPSPPRAIPAGWSVEWDKDQLLRQEGCCFWCGSSLMGIAHRDHVHPLARGGDNDVSNLVMACPPCNLDKGAADPAVWIRSTSRLSDERRLVVASIANLDLPQLENQRPSNPDSDTGEDDPIEFEVVRRSLFES